MTAPSAWQLEQVMSIAMATRARLQDEGVIDTEAAELFAECPDAQTMLVRMLRAMDDAKRSDEAVGERIADLNVRRARFQREHQECRAAAFAIMEALGLQKFKHPEFTVSISAGRPGVVITDEAALPDDFIRVTTAPDRAKIKTALENGEHVPGAEMQNTMPTLTVRTK